MAMNLKQLSEEIGLSQTTISRALNGYPEVKEETRAEVKRAADKYGYKPSRAAQFVAGFEKDGVSVAIALAREVQRNMTDEERLDFWDGIQAGYNIFNGEQYGKKSISD